MYVDNESNCVYVRQEQEPDIATVLQNRTRKVTRQTSLTCIRIRKDVMICITNS